MSTLMSFIIGFVMGGAVLAAADWDDRPWEQNPVQFNQTLQNYDTERAIRNGQTVQPWQYRDPCAR